MVLRLLFFILFLYGSLSYGQCPRYSDYENRPIDHYGAQEYYIHFPPNWTLDTSGLLRTEFIVTSPKKNDKDLFRENVSLQIKESKNLHDFVVNAEQWIRSNGTLLETHRHINDRGQEYHRIVYTLQERPDFIYEQYYFFKYWYLYELTAVYERDTFFENQKQGEEVLKTFGFKIPWSY